MSLLLVTATPMEMKPVLAWAGDVPRFEEGIPVPIRLGQRDALALVTGVGPVNAALSIGKALCNPDISHVFNLGIAGSFDLEAFPLLQHAVITKEIWPEFGLLTDDGIDPRGIGLAHGMCDGEPVWDTLNLDPEACAASLKIPLPSQWKRGSSLTVAGVTGTAKRADLVKKRYKVDFENMEGFSLGWGCRKACVPFCEIRIVSNKVGSRSKEDWDMKGSLRELGKASKKLFSSGL